MVNTTDPKARMAVLRRNLAEARQAADDADTPEELHVAQAYIRYAETLLRLAEKATNQPDFGDNR